MEHKDLVHACGHIDCQLLEIHVLTFVIGSASDGGRCGVAVWGSCVCIIIVSEVEITQ